MKHYGDVCAIKGAEVEKVDCITFGAPCQDLSIAGARRGMKHIEHGDGETTRSGLFYEAIRIIKEMREDDKQNGRADLLIRPRYGIYENVPGAFSSNGGKDFQAVLTEFVRVCEENAPDVPLPDKGKWPKAGCLYDELGRWSIAYRLHDAQYWGVPQRRKRLCVLADFNGLTAAELLFDPQYRRGAEDTATDETVGDLGGDAGPEVSSFAASLPRYTQPGGETGEGTAAGTESGSGGADRALSVDCRNAREGEVQTTLQAKASGGQSLNCGGVVRVQACDVYNQTVDGETAATVTAAAGGQAQADQKCFNPWDSQSERVYGSDWAWHSLNANESGGQSRDAVLHTPEERSF